MISESKHWWGQEEPHNEISSVLQRLSSDVDERNSRWKRYLCILMNKDVKGWSPGQIPGEETTWRSMLHGEKRLYINPIKNCLSTLASRIASQKIRPQPLTSTSSTDAFNLRRKARMLQKAIDGEWYRGDVYRKALHVFLAGGAVGMGAMACYPDIDEKRMCYEYTWTGELIIDEQACLTSSPRTLYQVRYHPAEILIEKFEKQADDIRSCIGKFGMGAAEPGYLKVTDLVQVVEAWHLGAKSDRSDGRHAVIIDNATLDMKEWRARRFPFAWFPWEPTILGFWPQGLVENEEPMQTQTNKLLRRIQDAMQIFATAHVVAPKGSVDAEKLTNITGSVIEYEGTVPPRVETPPSMSSEIYNFLWRLKQEIFESEGVSMLSAASVKPPGIESGVALRHLSETETGRHALLGQAWSQFFVDLAELTIDGCKAIGGYKSRYRTRDGYEEIKWSEIDMDRDAYELQVLPASFLPQTVSGRIQTVQELLQAGFIEAKQAVQLLDMPDLEQWSSMETAALEDIDHQIEMMLEGKEQHPESYMDLQLGLERVTSALLRARIANVPTERQQMLISWITEAAELLNPPDESGGAGGPPIQSEGMPAPIPGPQANVPLATPEQPLE